MSCIIRVCLCDIHTHICIFKKDEKNKSTASNHKQYNEINNQLSIGIQQ